MAFINELDERLEIPFALTEISLTQLLVLKKKLYIVADRQLS